MPVAGTEFDLIAAATHTYLGGGPAIYEAFEARIDQTARIRFNELLQLPSVRRALVIALDFATGPLVNEAYLLSEAPLAVDWNRPEEDAAWAHLQSEK